MVSPFSRTILIATVSCSVTWNHVDAVHTPNSEPPGGSLQQQSPAKGALRLHKSKKESAADDKFLAKADASTKSTDQQRLSISDQLSQTLNVATAMSRTAADAMQDDISGLVHAWVTGMVSWPPATLAKWQATDAQNMGTPDVPALPHHNETVGQLTDQLLKHLLTTPDGTAAIEQHLKTLQVLPGGQDARGALQQPSSVTDKVDQVVNLAAPSSNLARVNSLHERDDHNPVARNKPVGEKENHSEDAKTKTASGAQQQQKQIMAQAQEMVQQSKNEDKQGVNSQVGVISGANAEQNAVVQLLLKQLHTFQPTNEAQATAVKVLMMNLKNAYPGADPNGQIETPNGPMGSAQVNNPKLDEHFIASLGGGTGARVGGTGDPVMDHHLVQRMHTQDLAVLIILFVIYLVTLFFGWSITYRMSHNSSPVKYYTNPRFHQLATEAQDVDGFLATFNGTPKEVRLEVAGFVETVPEAAHVEWRGMHYQTTFYFSLDLSQWVVPNGEASSGDRAMLRQFLGTGNSLETVDIHKDVTWENWEELATNIKHTIRQNGFMGRVDVSIRGVDLVRVYQNHPWANFMHNRTTKALFALSIVGGLLYVPYMWLRCKRTSLSTKFKVECNISDYWHLIRDKLSATGFDAGLR